MAAKHYTSCTSASDYVDLSFTAIGFRNIFLMLLSGEFLAWIAVVLLGGPALLYAIAFFASAVVYLDWWLHGRLICLGHDQCVVGVITGLGPADPVEKGGDNDFSMNVLLAGSPVTYAEPTQKYWTSVQGHIVAEHPDVLAIGRAYVQDEGHKQYVTSLHSEFEGDGIAELLKWAKVILALLIAALFVPDVLRAILILLAVFLTLVNIVDVVTAPPALQGAGNPLDVDPRLIIGKGDIVAVKGTWVYDSLHHGWNEMHPVLACEVVGRLPLPKMDVIHDPPVTWPPPFDTDAGITAFVQRWCAGIKDADDAVDGGSGDDPANGWVVHPLVDGCKPPPIIL
ncbi:MAG: hypothetical protein AB7O28_06860 [Vicinamibacterales bacterium]